jgi:serine/threonine protein kinase
MSDCTPINLDISDVIEIKKHIRDRNLYIGYIDPILREIIPDEMKDVPSKVLVKIMEYPDITKSDLMKIKRQIKILKNISTNGISKYYGCLTEKKGNITYFYVLIEYVEGITLDKIIQDNVISQNQKLKILISLAETIFELHQKNVYHRNINPLNIIYNDEDVYLINFNISCLSTSDISITTQGYCYNTYLSHLGDYWDDYTYSTLKQGASLRKNQLARFDYWSFIVLCYKLFGGSMSLLDLGTDRKLPYYQSKIQLENRQLSELVALMAHQHLNQRNINLPNITAKLRSLLQA